MHCVLVRSSVARNLVLVFLSFQLEFRVLVDEPYVRLDHRRLTRSVSFFFFQAEDGIRDLTVTGVQTCALPISDEMERQGLDPRRSSLRLGIFGAEPWTNEMRANIEKRLSLEAFDLYGLSEVIGPGVAQECVESRDGLTLWEDHFYPEVVEAASGKPLADGEKGELILTSLTKEALPIIRYRTRDLTRLLPGTARAMRRMEKVTGRSDDMLIIRGVNLFPSQIEELILKQPGLSPHYALEISKDRSEERRVGKECRSRWSPYH